MIIKELPVGPIMANCFIVGDPDTNQAIIIDPGDEPDKILMACAESKLTIKYIINTHGHFDHVGANKKLKEVTKAPIVIHKLDDQMLSMLSSNAAAFGLTSEDSPPADKLVEDGDELSFGNLKLKVIHTPGHTPGGISILIEDNVFAGDTLFAGSIGRTDFPGGDHNTLISAIKTKLFPLGDDINVYCGHGPQTTIGEEKKTNPFVSE